MRRRKHSANANATRTFRARSWFPPAAGSYRDGSFPNAAQTREKMMSTRSATSSAGESETTAAAAAASTLARLARPGVLALP